jgi:3-oxoacyl-[acyl-carrier-protein] synthase II
MNIINASDLLTDRKRRADVMLAGGSDAVLTPTGVAMFVGVGATDKATDPSLASRPFHADAGGIVMGEGAAVMVLETLEHAKRRGALPLAEIAGYWEGSDAHHETEPSGIGSEDAMRGALIDARVSRDEKIFIDAHATGTRKGDASELEAIKNVFSGRQVEGTAFYPDQVIGISSRKGALGHTLGASGAIESVMAIRGMNESVMLPNLKIDADTLIPNAIDLPIVTGHAQRVNEQFVVLKNSFGFGGLNASIIYRRY